jgi:hypothetical protein
VVASAVLTAGRRELRRLATRDVANHVLVGKFHGLREGGHNLTTEDLEEECLGIGAAVILADPVCDCVSHF